MGIDKDVATEYTSVKVHLTFPNELFKTYSVIEPIIYEMNNIHDVVANISWSKLDIDRAWVVLEVSGVNSEIDKALLWIQSIGVIVDLTKSY